MKKIFFLFVLLPFSVFAELNPGDLEYIEGRLGVIANSSDLIEADVNTLVGYVNELVARANELVSEQNATQSQIETIRSLIASLNSTVESFRADVNNILPIIEYDVYAILTTVRSCKDKLDVIIYSTGNIYDALRPLGPISEDLALIKTLLYERFESLQSLITTVITQLEELNIKVQDIYDELLSQGYDIKSIKELLQGNKSYSRSLYYRQVPSFKVDSLGVPLIESGSLDSFTATNLFRLVEYFIGMEKNFGKVTINALLNNSFRLYDIQTNFYTSVSIQKDISTNVAYIASVITNSHDLLKLIASNVVTIARHTMPTNVADQYETQQQEQMEQISSSYQEHENDMSAYESSLTHIPSKIQKPLYDGVDYISRLNSPSTFVVNTLDDNIYAALPDYHSSLANMSFSLPIDIKLTPDLKQIFSIIRKCVTTTIWIFTFFFSLFLILKFVQFVEWIMTLLQPTYRGLFGNFKSGALYSFLGG